jgi:hypothetical protein
LSVRESKGSSSAVWKGLCSANPNQNQNSKLLTCPCHSICKIRYIVALHLRPKNLVNGLNLQCWGLYHIQSIL